MGSTTKLNLIPANISGYTVILTKQEVLTPVTHLSVNLLTESSLTLYLHWLEEELVGSCHQLNAEVEVISREEAPASVEVLEEQLQHTTADRRQGNLGGTSD